jgi:hypothetical protein
MLPSFAFLSDEQLVERARSLTEAVGEQLAGSGRRRPAEAGARDARGGGTRSTTPRQVLWLSRTLVGRSRAYARIAAQAPFVLAFEPPGVTRRRVRSALEDARYRRDVSSRLNIDAYLGEVGTWRRALSSGRCLSTTFLIWQVRGPAR